jgi:hypothetical protein
MNWKIQMDIVAIGSNENYQKKGKGTQWFDIKNFFKVGHLEADCYLTSKKKFSVGHDGVLNIHLRKFTTVVTRLSLMNVIKNKVDDYVGLEYWLGLHKEMLFLMPEDAGPECSLTEQPVVGYKNKDWDVWAAKQLYDRGGFRHKLMFTDAFINNIYKKINSSHICGVDQSVEKPVIWLNMKTFKITEYDREAPFYDANNSSEDDDFWSTGDGCGGLL